VRAYIEEFPGQHATAPGCRRSADNQVHPDTHVLAMVNNVIGVVNYVIAACPSLLNFVLAKRRLPEHPDRDAR